MTKATPCIGITLATTAATLFLLAPILTYAQDHSKPYLCYGSNSCQGQSACKTAKNSCRGMNSCQHQGATDVASEAECTEMDGKLLMDGRES